ncbi:phage baseplate protein [Ochrobactrum sp. 695/2009]|nr:GPW/gp25 family protein [Brucella intermedia]PJR88127.1 phage baseplate protein [Ochrobactrum sp. 721/2009]PJT13768.1 phage baseplate protein [Ochrobactrum sp. 720/2009]PJT25483.1 phage baseplate protein [Ochrobactrum sp. 715/2009]PJT31426.1 phage baseplate protein [Ochrobactrum sp. 695/2009]PJT32218.1 phage baseplate protein [Ochrobactrum sp. 689/2009]
MVGIDRHTGKVIAEPEHIRQSIEVILTTPVGTRIMREEFGVEYLDKTGKPKVGYPQKVIELEALRALAAYEPRIKDVAVEVTNLDQRLQSIVVNYTEVTSNEIASVAVDYKG